MASVSVSADGIVFAEHAYAEGVPCHVVSLPCGSRSKVLYTPATCYTLSVVRSAGDVVLFTGDAPAGTVELYAVPLAGGAVKAVVQGLAAGEVLDLATDGTSVYWLDEVTDAVMKADIASGAQTVLVTLGTDGLRSLASIALDEHSVYFSWSDCAHDGGCVGVLTKITPR